MNIGTSKEEVKKFVEQVAKTQQQSTNYSIMDATDVAFQLELVNSRLYDLYQKVQSSITMDTMKILLEVLEEYPRFTEYFNTHQRTSSQHTNDLP